jgi:L-fucose mutarotase
MKPYRYGIPAQDIGQSGSFALAGCGVRYLLSPKARGQTAGKWRHPGNEAGMLKGIDPLLGPGLLSALRGMGHGDEVVIADANFPAQSTVSGHRLIRADGVDAPRMVAAIASVLPLDDFVPAAAFRMAVVDKPDEVPSITAEFAAALATGGYRGPIEAIERFAFYERARKAFAIVATGETRLYGNLILKKGVVR